MDTEATRTPSETGRWSPPKTALSAAGAPPDAPGSAVEGRRLSGPIQGFGRMWQKTYRVRLGDRLTPEQVIAHWRAHYGELWPKGNRFYAPVAGVQPGEVAVLQGSVGGLRLTTGVLVLYADETSFAFLTPEGHPFAGLITFSAHRDEQVTVAQVQLLIRAHDPLTELGMVLGGHRKEDRLWEATLVALATSLGIDGAPTREVVCVDRTRQWRRFGNIRQGAAAWALRHPLGGPRGDSRGAVRPAGVLAVAAGLALVVGALTEPGVDGASGPAEALDIVAASPVAQRLSHVAYVVCGIALALLGGLWPAARGRGSRPAGAGSLGLVASGLALAAGSAIVAIVLVGAAVAGDLDRFAALHDRLAGPLVSAGIVGALASLALLWQATRALPAWLRTVGAGAAGLSAVGLVGAVWFGVEALGVLATPILLVFPLLVWTGLRWIRTPS